MAKQQSHAFTLISVLTLVIVLVSSIILFASSRKLSDILGHAASGSLSFESTSLPLSPTGTPVRVFVNGQGAKIGFLRLSLTYHPNEIELLDTISKSAAFPFEITKTPVTTANATGHMTLVVTPCDVMDKTCLTNTSTMPSALSQIATFTFRPKVGFKGQASVISIDVGDSQVVSTDSTLVPFSGQSVSLTQTITTPSIPTPSPSTTAPVATAILKTPGPTVMNTPTLAATSTFKGEYFDNKTMTGIPKLTRQDQNINFDWGEGSPASSIPENNFSVRWTKTTYFVAGMYRFGAIVDDGVRVKIDGQTKIDKLGDHPLSTFTTDVSLSAGNHTLEVDYTEAFYKAQIRFGWIKL